MTARTVRDGLAAKSLTERTRGMGASIKWTVVMVGIVLVSASAAPAALISLDVELTNGNSTARVYPSSPDRWGMSSWVIDGVDHLNRQWFWFRVGSTGADQAIDSLPVAWTQSAANTLDATYTGNGFTIAIQYTLTGGQPGSGTADIAETIAIHNTGGTALDFHFFQYSDFNLNGTPGGDVVEIGKLKNLLDATQTEGLLALSETSALAVAPSRYQAGFSSDLLALLADGLPTTLNNTASAGPGDVAWVFEWDQSIGAGRSLLISKDKLIVAVPEPTTLAFLGLGGIGWLAGWSRRRARQLSQGELRR